METFQNSYKIPLNTIDEQVRLNPLDPPPFREMTRKELRKYMGNMKGHTFNTRCTEWEIKLPKYQKIRPITVMRIWKKYTEDTTS